MCTLYFPNLSASIGTKLLRVDDGALELTQIGARECVLEDKGPFHEGIEEVMARCDVLCTSKSFDSFKGSKEEALKVS